MGTHLSVATRGYERIRDAGDDIEEISGCNTTPVGGKALDLKPMAFKMVVLCQ